VVFSSLYRVGPEFIRGMKVAVSKYDIVGIWDLVMTSFVKTGSVFPRNTSNYHIALCRNPYVSIALGVYMKFVIQRMKGGDEWRM
jgi:hypothetical protein